MKLYTNCEKFHCSMERTNDNIPYGIAQHLTITKKAKYPKIHPGVNICDICSFGLTTCNVNKIKLAQIVEG